jgi:flagellin-specific chaperone FliS
VGALNFDYLEQALPMHKLYQYCLDRAREGNLDEVKYIIGEFKEAWSEAHKVS